MIDPMRDAAAMFEATPCNRMLGLRLASRSRERCEVELPIRPEMLQMEGVVQGGIVSALADVAAVFLLWPDLQPKRTMTSIEFKMNFLAGARPGAPLRAIATPLRVGGTIAVLESEVMQGATLVAKGTFTYLLRDRQPDLHA